MRSRIRILCSAWLASCALAQPTLAAWPANGFPVAVAPCEQYLGDAVQDGSGGFIVFWLDRRDCIQFKLLAQRITSQGKIAAGWDAIGLGVCPLPTGQSDFRAVPDGQGGAVVVWEDGRSGTAQLYAQRIDTTGARLWGAGGVQLSISPGSQGGMSVQSDGSGGAVVAWSDTRYGRNDGYPHYHPFPNVFAQRIDPGGSRVWPDTGVAVCVDTLGQFEPSVIADQGQGSLITWFDGRGSAFLQHLDSAGHPLLAVNGVPVAGRFLGLAASDGAGGIVSAFTWGPDTQEDVWVQRIRADGSLVWPLNGVRMTSAPHKQECTAMLPDGTGGAYAAWHDIRNATDWDIYVQRVTGDGTIAAGWPENGLPVCVIARDQVTPALVPDGYGGCVVLWCDGRDSTDLYDVYAQRVMPDGSIAPGWPLNGVPICRAKGNQILPTGVPDGSGGLMAVWEDYRVYADVYAQHVSGAGVVGDTTVAPLVTLLVADASLDTVHVTWQRAAGAFLSGSVERREDGGVWQTVGSVRPDALGQMEFADTNIGPGRTYSYRLVVGNPPQELSEATVTIPKAFPLEVRRLDPNPASAPSLTITFSVPTRDPVSLDVLDVAGRRRSHETIVPGQLAPITRTLSIASGFEPGVYFVRLSQHGRSSAKRIAILR